MDDFIKKYQQIVAMTLQAGIKSVSIGVKNGFPQFSGRKHCYEFISACHRGYAKAQSQLIREIINLRNDDILSDSEKWYRELLLRKIADTMAFIILNHQTHIVRRLCIHDNPPHISSEDLCAALREAERLNTESRKTFTLVCDATTFIHVCDLLRIDFRKNPPKISFIELKSGKINDMLLTELEKFEPTKEAIKKLSNNPKIDKKFEAQAKRILKQKIRLINIKKTIENDEGIEVKYDRPIILLNPCIELEFYDSILCDLFKRAHEQELVAATVQHCIHIGVGFSKEKRIAANNAYKALSHAVYSAMIDTKSPIHSIRKEVRELVPSKEMLILIRPFESNLTGLVHRPFILWAVDKKYLYELINNTLSVLLVFDLAAFLWLVRSQGLKAELSSRKEAAKLTQIYGKRSVPVFGNRCIKISYQNKEHKLMAGMLGRFTNDFVAPLDILKHFKKIGDGG